MIIYYLVVLTIILASLLNLYELSVRFYYKFVRIVIYAVYNDKNVLIC